MKICPHREKINKWKKGNEQVGQHAHGHHKNRCGRPSTFDEMRFKTTSDEEWPKTVQVSVINEKEEKRHFHPADDDIPRSEDFQMEGRQEKQALGQRVLILLDAASRSRISSSRTKLSLLREQGRKAR